jgi:hypothetical protein
MSHDEVHENSSSPSTANVIDRIADFCRLCVARAGVDGMAVTFGSVPRRRELLVATDDFAESVCQLELTVGEGPGFDAVTAALPAVAEDLRGAIPEHRWPLFTPEALREGARAVAAYPVVLGDRTYGAVELYSRQPVRLTSVQHRQAADIAELIGLALVEPGAGESIGAGLRMTVHQAAGMVMIQAGISIHDALVLLRSTAFAEDTRVTDLAAEVVAGRRRFEETETVDD